MSGVYVFAREAYKGAPAGLTVTKHEALPVGEFGLTEYTWDDLDLWFVDGDEFSDDERQAAYEAVKLHVALGRIKVPEETKP
jgi:hypothetical protein